MKFIADVDLRVEMFYSKDLMLLLLNKLHISTYVRSMCISIYVHNIFTKGLLYMYVCTVQVLYILLPLLV